MKKTILGLAIAAIIINVIGTPIGVASAATGSTASFALDDIDSTTSLASAIALDGVKAPKPEKTIRLKVTAYTSSEDETDDTPFTTAMGTKTRYGVVATNVLPFKTKVRIPELFGDQIFIVEDRMNRRMKNVIDIWMPTKRSALRFGVTFADIVIVEEKRELALQ